MRKTVPITENDFNRMVQIKNFEEMSDEELDVYTEIFMEKINTILYTPIKYFALNRLYDNI